MCFVLCLSNLSNIEPTCFHNPFGLGYVEDTIILMYFFDVDQGNPKTRVKTPGSACLFKLNLLRYNYI